MLQIVPPRVPPLGLYIRADRNGHTALVPVVQSGARISGVVVHHAMRERQFDLHGEVLNAGVDLVLDPQTLELAMPGGFEKSGNANLPWATGAPHQPNHLRGPAGERLVDGIVRAVADGGYTSVISPSHYLTGPADDWFEIDRDLVRKLRSALDGSGAAKVAIYYRLAVPGVALRDVAKRKTLKAGLDELPVDAVWLLVHRFGTNDSGPVALHGYIFAAWDFHSLGLPVVAERTGTAGLPLMAFGAAGGIESGITLGERFDVSPLLTVRKGTGFARPPQVYLPNLGAHVSRDVARRLFAHRSMRVAYACKDTSCCRNGHVDMIADPRGHFLRQRAKEVEAARARSRAPSCGDLHG